MASPSFTYTETNRFSVLFVSFRNICRSPAAEGVFTDLVNKRGLNSKFKIDSASTDDVRGGHEADPKIREAFNRRGIQITSISRPISPLDFMVFDLILATDKQNRKDILEAFDEWKGFYSLPDDAHKKVKLICSYCKKHDETEVPDSHIGGSPREEREMTLQRVLMMIMMMKKMNLMYAYYKKHGERHPDPYYGGPQVFEKVLDLLEDACGSLLESILTESKPVQE